MRPTLGRYLALLGLLIGAGTLLAQFALTMSLSQANGRTVLGSVIFFFSFFTILSNLLAASCFAAFAFPGCRHVAVFRAPKVATAIALYMLVVAAIYIAILEGLWAPQGLMRVLDTLLHYVMPALFLVFWVAFVPKGGTAYADIPGFLAFPALYGAYVMIRGALTGDYPYPILDAGTLGYPAALANMAAILALFLILGLAFIAVDRWAGKRAGTASSV
ncbi:Pr6Pr family membrane protein [Taklimakanibacter albus]|uniref:Pr6Pr family membrane protein n=1 Tax=Taklimakanibacter albus TaxID=2800327 RepID=A0ACC5QXW6_9HYPH|nr:Pr6Pr family membrane protein [Aestuariivirga sp. YIM B02566]MBK1865228.1 Pr6Pr family membrane protein [Aestuariivirga sp. YIM B02566]